MSQRDNESFWHQLFSALTVVATLITLVSVAYIVHQSGIWK